MTPWHEEARILRVEHGWKLEAIAAKFNRSVSTVRRVVDPRAKEVNRQWRKRNRDKENARKQRYRDQRKRKA